MKTLMGNLIELNGDFSVTLSTAGYVPKRRMDGFISSRMKQYREIIR